MYQAFEQALSQAVSEGRIAGAAALVCDRDGVTYQHAGGRRSVSGEVAMDAATVFWIASMTKAITSIAALQLAERGKLSLDGPLTALLPDLAELQVLEGFDDQGAPRLRPARRAPTLRQLLTHTSGFAYGFTSADLAAYGQTPGAVDPNGGTRAAQRQPLLFDPGEGWIYGIGIDWAGLAVEVASGQRLDAYFAENILEPLGMGDTGFALTAEREARRAGMHVRGPDGALVPIPFAMPIEPEVLSGGGGLYSTVSDYGRFLRALLNRGRLDGVQVLSAELVDSLGEVQTGAERVGAGKSAMANLANDFDLIPGRHTGHGLATLIAAEGSDHGRQPGSLAWAGLGNTYYWADPAAGIAGVLMTQLLPFADPQVLGLFAALERGAYGNA